MVDLKALGQLKSHALPVRSRIDVVDATAVIAVKVPMLLHIRAEPCRPSIHIYLPDQTAFHESVQTIIDSRHRDVRHLMFGPQEHLFSSRMIPLIEKNIINMLTLRRKPEAARR